MIMIVISNLVMTIVEREPSGFRITVKVKHQPITTVCWHLFGYPLMTDMRGYYLLVS